MDVTRNMRSPLWLAAMLMLGACAGGSASSSETKAEPVVRAPVKVELLSHKKALAQYPCQQCHQHVQSSETPITAHGEIRVDHMEGGNNCQTCHDEKNPENLRLASGKSYDLDDVHELCRQCHSGQVADWEVGIHGKQVGNWLTGMQRFACTGCHDPHKPALAPVQALRPLPFPDFGIPKGAH